MGATVCTSHGGNAPAVRAKAAVCAEVSRWGLGDSTVDPGEVLLRLVSQAATRVEHYALLLESAYEAARRGSNSTAIPEGVAALIGHRYALGPGGVLFPVAEAIRGLVQLEGEERDRCARFAALAVGAGLAKQRVHQQEQIGRMILRVLISVASDPELRLDENQRASLPGITRRHLELVTHGSGGMGSGA